MPDVFELPETTGTEVVATDDELTEDDGPKGAQEYEQRYVAFIDILGFKELIFRSKTAKSGPASIGAIHNAMSVQFSGFVSDYASFTETNYEAHDLRVNTFSDFVVISCTASEQGLDVLCFVVWSVARDWLSKGYLSRGGISKGEVIHQGGTKDRPGLVFGPAFIEAYQLEQDVAELPRVVVSKAVRKDVTEYQKNGAGTIAAIKKLVHRCEDGPMCIDLFAHLRADGFMFLGEDHRSEAQQFSQTLVDQIDHGADVPRWHRKTEWLLKKFNAAVAGTKYADLTIKVEST